MISYRMNGKDTVNLEETFLQHYLGHKNQNNQADSGLDLSIAVYDKLSPNF